ncbi:MAG: hypothetical protein ONB46_25060, partial [candidate division KSB1 bacterium]|nr:hypothetical protein [candidate division KSB1 bacterium]
MKSIIASLFIFATYAVAQWSQDRIPSVKSIFSLADEFCIFLHVHPIKEENHDIRNPTHAARPG